MVHSHCCAPVVEPTCIGWRPFLSLLVAQSPHHLILGSESGGPLLRGRSRDGVPLGSETLLHAADGERTVPFQSM